MICTVLVPGVAWPTSPYSSSKKPAGGTKHLIQQYIRTHPGCTSRQITEAFGMDTSTIRLHLRHLRDSAKVSWEEHSIGKGGTCKELHYRVAI